MLHYRRLKAPMRLREYPLDLDIFYMIWLNERFKQDRVTRACSFKCIHIIPMTEISLCKHTFVKNLCYKSKDLGS